MLPNTGDGTDGGDNWTAVINALNTMMTDLYTGAVTVGGSSTVARGPELVLSSDVTQIGSSATNTTQTLKSYTLAASTLATNGNRIQVVAWGTFAGNAAPKTMQLNWGGMNINNGAVTQSGSSWQMTANVYRTAANAQTAIFTGVSGGVNTATKATTDTSVDTGTIGISVQGLDASAAQSNILTNGLVVSFFS
jgi:hypothetical protein